MQETTRVAFTGAGRPGLALGDEGVVLASDGYVSHVKMAATGEVVAIYDHDLVVTALAVESSIDDSLEVGTLTAFSARHSFDEGGEVAVVNAMAANGHMASFSDVAEEALTLVASRVRQDPSFRQVLASLDEEEGESVVRLASACLIRDAFGAEED